MHEGSTEVVVLTVNAMDPTKEYLRKWLDQRGYDFPVLWAGGYTREVGVRGYPTTWVVDREGRIVFNVVGGTDHFAQEFGWRVDALLGG